MPKADDLKTWLAIAGAILAAGMWLGSLERRVIDLERHETYEHGTYDVPKER